MAAAARDKCEIAREAAGRGPMLWLLAHVPLPGHVSFVAGVLQYRSDCSNAIGEETLVPRLSLLIRGCELSHVTKSSDVAICTAEQHRTGRRTRRTYCELGEPNADRGQGIDIGRADFAAKTSEVRIAGIVRDDENDVWPDVLCKASSG